MKWSLFRNLDDLVVRLVSTPALYTLIRVREGLRAAVGEGRVEEGGGVRGS